MPHPAVMAEWRRARSAKAGAARLFAGYCAECGLLATSGVLVCEHGVSPSSRELVRQEVATLNIALNVPAERRNHSQEGRP